MPRTALVVTILKQNNYAVLAGDLAVAMAADLANGNQIKATGREILIVSNTDVAAHTFTVTSLPDHLGRTGDIAAYSIPAGTVHAINLNTLEGWVQPDGNIYLQTTNALLLFGVLRY